MATVVRPPSRAANPEERFFRTMALVIAGVLVAGFGFNLGMGRSSFTASPVVLHLHAVVFFGWTALFVLQNFLVTSGNIALHRRLGWLTALLIPVMVVLATLVGIWSLQAHGGPPFFAMNQFAIQNPLAVYLFGSLAVTGIVLRKRTDWHRRFLFSAMAVLIGPGIGRLLPMPFLIPWGWWISSVLPTLLLIGIAMLADRRRLGHVHPALFWTFGLILGVEIAGDVIAYSPIGYSITHMIVDGTPGAARPMEAFFPS